MELRFSHSRVAKLVKIRKNFDDVTSPDERRGLSRLLQSVVSGILTGFSKFCHVKALAFLKHHFNLNMVPTNYSRTWTLSRPFRTRGAQRKSVLFFPLFTKGKWAFLKTLANPNG
ncbi:hypothetical protein AVEN_155335-1 [Araneus ventricosus]|uniref:Uncharacterized protein n=1 Tax=Araneus ventricosus TaxID=182803 RepID=A0A4Y2QL57_ARAVE|nr:hypothetical protein AVEN_36373-1 [Araneus ventricosus]GBN64053.1 hypothetical protein AVEN_155335-1 [Araneus ventricosus]